MYVLMVYITLMGVVLMMLYTSVRNVSVSSSKT